MKDKTSTDIPEYMLDEEVLNTIFETVKGYIEQKYSELMSLTNISREIFKTGNMSKIKLVIC